MVGRPIAPGASTQPAVEPLTREELRARVGNVPPSSAEEADEQARAYLDALGRAEHPDAATNPIYALYQVAVDYCCTAHGYRELYLHRKSS